eukprot:SAG22_NODE_1461_length_4369_cov_4.685012_3_plen_221_part_00
MSTEVRAVDANIFARNDFNRTDLGPCEAIRWETPSGTSLYTDAEANDAHSKIDWECRELRPKSKPIVDESKSNSNDESNVTFQRVMKKSTHLLHSMLTQVPGVVAEIQLSQRGQRGERGDVVDLVVAETQSSQRGQRGERGEVGDLVVAETQYCQQGQRGQRGEVGDLVVPETQSSQRGQRDLVVGCRRCAVLTTQYNVDITSALREYVQPNSFQVCTYD